ncbi:MAG: hypothetical protein NVV59_06915 [Chitinophagaceae bacterium]|nr:hypothetical protein [Chitinophagaceae bacterium]
MTPQSRKQFLATAAALVVAPSVLWSCNENKTGQMQVLHHVFFWLKRPGNAEDRAELITGLRTLSTIPEVKNC